jgi:hypothetical protein
VRLPSPRFLIGLILVLAVCVTAAVLLTQGKKPAAQPVVTVTCVGGSEKTALMADPQVVAILRDTYRIKVDFTPLGSYDQAQLSTADITAKHLDCLWPSSESAQKVFESLHQGAYPAYRSETVLQSPEVIYAGPQGTDALLKAKIVEQRDNRYYIVNMKSLLLEYVLQHRTWESLGTADLRGPITISSTDPAKSNSGFTLTQLELNIIATSDVFQAPSLAQARKGLSTVRALYDAQGLQAGSSDQGFRQWLLQGAEIHAPLYAGYENQIMQAVVQSGQNSAALLSAVRVLYPDPTIYSDHPILALDHNAATFIDAMKDPRIQTIAWKVYGFRSGTQVGLNNVADFKNLPLAEQVRTTTPPNADVTLALLACIEHVEKCQ